MVGFVACLQLMSKYFEPYWHIGTFRLVIWIKRLDSYLLILILVLTLYAAPTVYRGPLAVWVCVSLHAGFNEHIAIQYADILLGHLLPKL